MSTTRKRTTPSNHGNKNDQTILGEKLAILSLQKAGYTNIYSIRFNRKLTYGHVLASKGSKKYVIQIVTRDKYNKKGGINDRYILIGEHNRKELLGSPSLVQQFYGAIPAWMTVTLETFPDGRKYSIYFGKVNQLNGKNDIYMRKDDLKKYDRLAKNESVLEAIQSMETGCDILIIIPAEDEFLEFRKRWNASLIRRKDDIFYYSVGSSTCGYQIWCLMLGKPGIKRAVRVTSSAISYCKPRLIVLIGTSGAISKDLLLGDVVVGDTIVAYEENKKAVDDEKAGYRFLRSCETLTPPENLTELARNYGSINKSLYKKWKDRIRTHINKRRLELPEDTRKLTCKSPNLIVGHIASGDTNSQSISFVHELLEYDRKLLVVEMEAAGVAEACGYTEKYLIIRGISDFADNRKEQLDRTEEGFFRRLAVMSATTFFQHYLQLTEFHSFFSE